MLTILLFEADAVYTVLPKRPNSDTSEISISHLAPTAVDDIHDIAVRLPRAAYTEDYTLTVDKAAKILLCTTEQLTTALKSLKYKNVFTTQGKGKTLRLSESEVTRYRDKTKSYLTTEEAELALLVRPRYLTDNRKREGSATQFQEYIKAERIIGVSSQVYSFQTLLEFSVRNSFNTEYLEALAHEHGEVLVKPNSPKGLFGHNVVTSTDQTRPRPKINK